MGKKTSSREPSDELRPEYDLDFKAMRPNRFAIRLKGKPILKGPRPAGRKTS